MKTLALYCQEPRFFDMSEMGAGKTWGAAAIGLGAIEDNLVDHTIIVAPKAVLYDWVYVYRDVLDCDFCSTVTIYKGTMHERPNIALKPIIVTTYEAITADYKRFFELAQTKRLCVIYDEAHKLKNHESSRSKLLTQLAHLSVRAYLLTGTPLTNGLKNAFSYINILFPGEYYRSWNSFKLRHIVYNRNNKHQIIMYKNIADVQEILDKYSVRHLKREILDLPPITYKTRLLDWNPAQKKFYKQLMDDCIIELNDRFIEATDIGPRLIRMHQILTHPEQLGLPCTSTRWDVIDDDLESIGLDDHKVVIFAHYRLSIERLKEKFKEYNPAVVYGGTKDVEAEKVKFNTDPTCRLFIAHPKSAGLGINLTVSSHVIFFEYSYDLDDYDQAVARVDRPGQKKDVTIINYAIRGSMEETKILPALINKKAFSMSVLRDPEEFMKFISFTEPDDYLV